MSGDEARTSLQLATHKTNQLAITREGRSWSCITAAKQLSDKRKTELTISVHLLLWPDWGRAPAIEFCWQDRRGGDTPGVQSELQILHAWRRVPTSEIATRLDGTFHHCSIECLELGFVEESVRNSTKRNYCWKTRKEKDAVRVRSRQASDKRET